MFPRVRRCFHLVASVVGEAGSVAFRIRLGQEIVAAVITREHRVRARLAIYSAQRRIVGFGFACAVVVGIEAPQDDFALWISLVDYIAAFIVRKHAHVELAVRDYLLPGADVVVVLDRLTEGVGMTDQTARRRVVVVPGSA